ncbi:MAG: T9SS type A sorting domain-containing protein [Bacteroidales bacterium]|jgi:hypothetical protein|nr:T9SS type A sorting domain-containing protein [Bacteroidales bacterium]
MKTIIFLLFISISWSIYAQDFLIENKTWSQVFITSGNHSKSTSIFKISSDTVIHSQTYKKVLISNDSTKSWQLHDWALREDAGIVIKHHLNFDNDEEDTLYNFNVSEGDSIKIDNNSPYQMHVDSIKMINTLRYFFLSIGNFNTIWIQGVGNIDNLFEPTGNTLLVGGSSHILCCKSENNDIYINKNFNTCYLNSVDIEELSSTEDISFQQSENTIKISSILNKNHIQIFSLRGELCTEKILDMGTKEFDLSHLPSGIYIVIINKKFKKKIIIQ